MSRAPRGGHDDHEPRADEIPAAPVLAGPAPSVDVGDLWSPGSAPDPVELDLSDLTAVGGLWSTDPMVRAQPHPGNPAQHAEPSDASDRAR